MCYKILLEPITHFLTGAVLSRAGFNRKTALATGTMTLAAEASDLDVISSFHGPVFGFAHHRGFTHSFLGLLLVSAVVTGFMYLIWRVRGRKTNIPGLGPRWGLLFLFAYIAGLSHILLDFTNNYGVRPFWPFWEKWYSWNVAFIVEPPLYLFLLLGLILPQFIRRTPQGLRTTAPAILALVCIVAMWGSRFYEARKFSGALRRHTFNSEAPLRASVFPYWTPAPEWLIAMRWSAVIETHNFFLASGFDTHTHDLESATLSIIPKFPDTPATLAARRSYLGRVYLDWAGYPVLTETTDGQDSVVYFRDLRFAYPILGRGNVLGASVKLDSNLHIIGEFMGPREQRPPL